MLASDCLFCSRTPLVGKTIMIYENHQNIKPIVLKEQGYFNNRFGLFHHERILNTPLGSKVHEVKDKGYIYTLTPSPELWTKGISKRTQILYRADIAMIIGNLNIKPGSIVVEAGTGSGSLSVSIIRTLLPHGKLFTFEFNEGRAAEANSEFQQLGLINNVVSEHRDVIENGFAHTDYQEADAIFLDLPCPWNAIGSAKQILKTEGSICSFSPCIEQVQKSCLALKKHDFQEIRTVEILIRPYVARTQESGNLSIQIDTEQERLHTGYLTFAIK